MGPSVRRLALVAALLVTPSLAAAQGGGLSPPPGGGSSGQGGAGPTLGGGGNSGGSAASPPADVKKGPPGQMGGYAYSDKPAARSAPATGRFVRRTGPLATFPGFEQLPDGGSRLFVHVSQSVPVEERKAQGTVTYVLKGAHLRVHNDSNALVTVHFNTPVFRARLIPQGNDLLFILEMRSAAAPTFKVQDNQDKSSTLTIDFAKGDFIPGDGSEALPSESPPKAARASRAGKRKGGPTGAPPPPTDNGDADPAP